MLAGRSPLHSASRKEVHGKCALECQIDGSVGVYSLPEAVGVKKSSTGR